MKKELRAYSPESMVVLPAGTMTAGRYGKDNTPLLVFEPYEYDSSEGSRDFLLATGLLTRPEQYQELGENLLTLHDRLLVVGYDHNYHRFPIRANASAIVDVATQLEDEHHFVAVGHSMGTIAMLLALEDSEFHKRVLSLVQVNPAMTGDHLRAQPEDLFNLERELLVLAATRPQDLVRHVWSGASEVIFRPRVIANQVLRLISGKVHERYVALMKENPDLPIYVFYNQHDGLVPARWGLSVAGMGENVNVYIHDSKTHLAHAAINHDPEYAIALHALAQQQSPPASYKLIGDTIKHAA